jgi:hypothetical protein
MPKGFIEGSTVWYLRLQPQVVPLTVFTANMYVQFHS